MIVFYFSHYAPSMRDEVVSYLASFKGSQNELREALGGNQPPVTFAVFDDEHAPPQLVYRWAVCYCSFKDARRVLPDDFPKFYVGVDGSIWDADSYSKIPLMEGPGFPNVLPPS